LKKVVWALVGLVVVLVGAVLVAPSVIDWNSYKPEIAAKVRELTGRDLVIAGDINAQIFPAPTLTAENVSISSIEGAQSPDLATLRSVEVRIALAPLLGGHVRIENVRLIEPQINLEVLADGRNSWTILQPDAGALPSDEATASVTPSGGKSEGPAISLDDFDIVDGQLTYEDAGTSSRQTVSGINLNIAAASLTEGPFRAQGSLLYNGIRLGIDADIGAIVEGRTLPVDVGLTIGGDSAKIQLSGTVLGLDDTPRFRGDLNVLSENIGRVATAFAKGTPLPTPLHQPFSIKGVLDASQTSLSLENFDISIGGATGKGTISGNFKGTPTLKANVNIDQIDINSWMAPANTASAPKKSTASSAETPSEVVKEIAEAAAFSLPQGLNVTASIRVGEIALSGDAVRNVVLNAELANGEMTLSQFSLQTPGAGELALFGFLVAKDGKPSFDGQFEAKIKQPRTLMAWLKSDTSALKVGKPGATSLAVGFSGTPQQISIRKLNLSFDETNITGAATLVPGDVLGIGATINMDRLNLDAYLADVSSKAPAKAAASKPAQPTEQPTEQTEDQGTTTEAVATPAPTSPFEALRALAGINANLRTKIGSLTVNAIPLEKIDADIGLVDGDLTIRNFVLGNALSVSARMTGMLNGVGRGVPVAKAFALRAEVGDPNGLANRFGVDLPYNNKSIGKPTFAADLNGPLTAPSLVSTVTGFDATLIADGTVRPFDAVDMFDIGLRLRHDDFAALMRRLDTGYVPSGKIGGVNIASMLKGNANRIAFSDLVAAVGQAKITGNGRVDLDGARPALTATLDAGKLIVDPFLPAQKTATLWPALPARMQPARYWVPNGGAGGADALRHLIATVSERWSAVPLDLSAMKSLDADLTLTAPEVAYHEYVLKSAKLFATLSDGLLKVGEFSGIAFDGNVMSSGVMDARTDKASLAGVVAVDKMNIGQASKAAGISGSSGMLTSKIEVASVGASPAQWVSALGGKGAIEIRGIKGESSLGDMPVIGLALGPLLQVFEVLNSGLGSLIGAGANTKIGETDVTSTFDIANGTLTTNDTKIISNLYKGDIKGTVNLPLWSMNVGGSLAMDQGLLGTLLANVARVPSKIPFEVTGDIDKPNVKIKPFSGAASEGGGGIKVPGLDKLEKKVPGVGGLLQGLLGGGQTAPQAAPESPTGDAPPAQNAPPPQQPSQQQADPTQQLLNKLFK
tara:strand:- start:8753 stop:12361 length:3609 start_codon:yes stop_codon:yes gene_type:complete